MKCGISRSARTLRLSVSRKDERRRIPRGFPFARPGPVKGSDTAAGTGSARIRLPMPSECRASRRRLSRCSVFVAGRLATPTRQGDGFLAACCEGSHSGPRLSVRDRASVSRRSSRRGFRLLARWNGRINLTALRLDHSHRTRPSIASLSSLWFATRLIAESAIWFDTRFRVAASPRDTAEACESGCATRRWWNRRRGRRPSSGTPSASLGSAGVGRDASESKPSH